ncbi:hypothetical protein Hanom_Chr13g01227511 [Helianthus anomalus]
MVFHGGGGFCSGECEVRVSRVCVLGMCGCRVCIWVGMWVDWAQSLVSLVGSI